jgi:hypothetical protein
MADFEYAFASAGTPNSFPIPGTGVTGIDEAGTLTPKVIRLAPNMTVVITGTYTLAEIAQAMLDYLRPRGYARQDGGGAVPVTYDKQEAPTLTEVVAAD